MEFEIQKMWVGEKAKRDVRNEGLIYDRDQLSRIEYQYKDRRLDYIFNILRLMRRAYTIHHTLLQLPGLLSCWSLMSLKLTDLLTS